MTTTMVAPELSVNEMAIKDVWYRINGGLRILLGLLFKTYDLHIFVDRLSFGDVGVRPYLVDATVSFGNRKVSLRHREDRITKENLEDVLLDLKIQLRRQTLPLEPVAGWITKRRPGCKAGVEVLNLHEKAILRIKWDNRYYDLHFNPDASCGVIMADLGRCVDTVVPIANS